MEVLRLHPVGVKKSADCNGGMSQLSSFLLQCYQLRNIEFRINYKDFRIWNHKRVIQLYYNVHK